jgi:N-acetyl-beta-hexosaminidase
MTMDLNKLRTAVFEKTGIRIDTNDPVFALVALNEAVLAECVEKHAAILHQATDKLTEQTRQLLEAGERHKRLLQQMASLVETGKTPEIASAMAEKSDTSGYVPGANNRTAGMKLASSVGIAALTATLTISGMWLLKEHAPTAQSLPQIAAQATVLQLTPQQIQLIKNGEKFDRMWAQLDEATKTRIQGAVDKP